MCSLSSSLLIASTPAIYGWSCAGIHPVSSVCDWSGIRCESGVVTEINLSKKELHGSLPYSIGMLSSISSILFANSSLGGSIPSTLSLLTRLVYLDFHSTLLSGSLPNSLCAMSVSYLNVEDTNISCFDPCYSAQSHMHLGSLNPCNQSKLRRLYSMIANIAIS